jgi:hypothetical protein
MTTSRQDKVERDAILLATHPPTTVPARYFHQSSGIIAPIHRLSARWHPGTVIHDSGSKSLSSSHSDQK